MSCHGLNTLNPICQIGSIGSNVASDAFARMADWFAQAAADAATGLWGQIGSATTVNLSSRQLSTDLLATSSIAAVLCLGLFVIQVITAVLRREPAGLARALKGLGVALVASVFALAVTKALLTAVDALSDGVVAYTMHTNMAGLGDQLALAGVASSSNNPAIILLLSVVVLAAVVVVWAAMMIRKMMIIIAAVLTPLAFSGATADITRSWVRRWIEFMAAMIASKLLLVIIFMVGVSVLEGAGHTPGAGAGQDLTQLIIGALILLMGGFAPWIAIRMFHFAGDTLQSAHATAAHGTSGGRTLITAPQKVNALHTQASSTMSKLAHQSAAPHGQPPPSPPTTGTAAPPSGNGTSAASTGATGGTRPTGTPDAGRAAGSASTTPAAGSPAAGGAGAGGASAGSGGAAAVPVAAVATPIAMAGAALQTAQRAGRAARDATEQAHQPVSGPPPRAPQPPTP